MSAPVDRMSAFADEFVDIARFHACLWEMAFRQQLRRVSVEDEPGTSTLVDFVFVVIALHNFRLSLRRWHDELKSNMGRGPGVRDRRQAASWAGQALEIFERGLPQVTQIRNAFSHFEEYAYGSGRLQRNSGEPVSVLSGGANVFVVKVADIRFELDLGAARDVMESVRECLLETLVYSE